VCIVHRRQILAVCSQPPSGFCILHMNIRGAGGFQKGYQFGFVGFWCAFDHHYKLVVGGAETEMMFSYEGRHLTEITKGKHHAYRSKQNGKLEGDGYPRRKSEMRLTSEVQWPVVDEAITDAGQRGSGSRNSVDEAGCMQACFPEAHGVIQTVDRHGCVYVVHPVAGFPN